MPGVSTTAHLRVGCGGDETGSTDVIKKFLLSDRMLSLKRSQLIDANDNFALVAANDNVVVARAAA